MLLLIARVGLPDTCRFEVRCSLSSLLDLGAGFHPDLTGRENVIVNGVIIGMTRMEVERRFDEIVAFAELEAFIDNPMRTYSTGMRMRLAFSLAVLSEPSVLLVDEVLTVGDLAFQEKCTDRITELRSRGCTMLLCSHDANLIVDLCDRAAWLENGRVTRVGPAQDVLDAYTRASRRHD
jgi:lipopolysaccharide transport system ATP-binding protein